MPPRRGRWPSSKAKTHRDRQTTSWATPRSFILVPPTMGDTSAGFSMKDEARNTASHRSSLNWASGDAKLRQKPVTFVSAGVVEPLKEPISSDNSSNSDTIAKPPEHALGSIGDVPQVTDPGASITETRAAIQVEMTVEAAERGAYSGNPDVAGQYPGAHGQPFKAMESNADDLFFLDTGEDHPMTDLPIPPPKIPSPGPSSADSDSSEEVILYRGRTGRGPLQKPENLPDNFDPEPRRELPQSQPPATAESLCELGFHEMTSTAQSSQKRSKYKRRRAKVPESDVIAEEDAILADYIANMAANSDDDLITTHLQSFSGYRDLGGEDDAVNLGLDNEKSPENDMSLGKGESTESDGSDAGCDNLEQMVDADIDDETLAHRLAKQEELGMNDDDLLLFTSSLAQTEARKMHRQRSTATRRNRILRGPASATEVADAFDNLDLADWDQLIGPSRKRRSKQPPRFNVSDSEVEAALRTAWQRDRERKKSRKLERETLRASGLLGKNADPDDLRVKYRSGMKLDDIKAELCSFLLSSAERLDFPPLDKHARKVLHELASRFDIKSQSIGKGDQRRPVLYRTKRTIRYSSTQLNDVTIHVNQAALRIHRKYFHRADLKVQTQSPRTGSGARPAYKALSLREGEIVGASVPELGQQNKGRAMLEKMGWSKGMSLGALDNDGILEPVAQVVKRSKAGLG